MRGEGASTAALRICRPSPELCLFTRVIIPQTGGTAKGGEKAERQEMEQLERDRLAGPLPMPAFNSCKPAAVTWHRMQEGLQCTPAGSTAPATHQCGCVSGAVLNP